jgi:hypothetical protein
MLAAAFANAHFPISHIDFFLCPGNWHLETAGAVKLSTEKIPDVAALAKLGNELEAAFTVYAVTTDTLFLCDALQGLSRRINTYKGANHSHGQYSQGLQPMTIFQNFCIHDGLQVLELIQTIGASDYSA